MLQRREFHIYIVEYLQLKERMSTPHESNAVARFVSAYSQCTGKCPKTKLIGPFYLKFFKTASTPPPLPPPPRLCPGPLRSDEVLLWVCGRGVVGVRPAVEREPLAVLPRGFSYLRFPVSVRLFSAVEESGCYRQASQGHKDGHRYDACKKAKRTLTVRFQYAEI